MNDDETSKFARSYDGLMSDDLWETMGHWLQKTGETAGVGFISNQSVECLIINYKSYKSIGVYQP